MFIVSRKEGLSLSSAQMSKYVEANPPEKRELGQGRGLGVVRWGLGGGGGRGGEKARSLVQGQQTVPS